MSGSGGFSSTSAIIDYDKKRIKLSDDIFGIIPIGKWVQVLPTMKIGVKKSNQTYRAYSQGNPPLDITKKDFRIILFDSEQNEIMPIKRFDSLDGVKAEPENIGNQ